MFKSNGSTQCSKIIFISAMAIALGWGSTKQNEVGDPHIPKELQQVEQPLVTLPTCQRSWSVVPATPNVDRAYVVTDSMVCAGYATGDRRHCSLDQGLVASLTASFNKL